MVDVGLLNQVGASSKEKEKRTKGNKRVTFKKGTSVFRVLFVVDISRISVSLISGRDPPTVNSRRWGGNMLSVVRRY